MNQRPHVANAADRAQVKNASRMEAEQAKRSINDLRVVMETVEGRRWLWGHLGYCGIDQSIWHPSALIHYNAGKQDVGAKVKADMITASSDGYLLTQKEAIDRSKLDDTRVSAFQTKAKENTDG